MFAVFLIVLVIGMTAVSASAPCPVIEGDVVDLICHHSFGFIVITSRRDGVRACYVFIQVLSFSFGPAHPLLILFLVLPTMVAHHHAITNAL